MNFEYDQAKSASNKIKHGIDFEEAKMLWHDENRIEAPVFRPGEERFLLVGQIGHHFWTAVITYRGETVRIISVRRARKEEIFKYDENKAN